MTQVNVPYYLWPVKQFGEPTWILKEICLWLLIHFSLFSCCVLSFIFLLWSVIAFRLLQLKTGDRNVTFCKRYLWNNILKCSIDEPLSWLLGLLDQGHSELLRLLTTVYRSLMAAAFIYFHSLTLCKWCAWLHGVPMVTQTEVKAEEININSVNCFFWFSATFFFPRVSLYCYQCFFWLALL